VTLASLPAYSGLLLLLECGDGIVVAHIGSEVGNCHNSTISRHWWELYKVYHVSMEPHTGAVQACRCKVPKCLTHAMPRHERFPLHRLQGSGI
jgi:hypothetical protein